MSQEQQDVLLRKLFPTEGKDHNNIVELVFEDTAPIGIRISLHDNGRLKCSEFLQGGQAEDVCTTAKMDPLMFVDTTIVGVNDKEQSVENTREIYDQLKDPSRPKSIRFELRAAIKRKSHAVAMEKDESLVELVFRENRPLGIRIRKQGDSILKVCEFPKQSQASAVANELGINPDVFQEARIVGVNRKRYQDREDLRKALKTPSRPKAVLFIVKLRRPSQRELLQTAVLATESMLQLFPRTKKMERMNAEAKVLRKRRKSQNKTSPSIGSGVVLKCIKNLARMDNMQLQAPSTRHRAVRQGLKDLNAGLRKKSPTNKEFFDRVMNGSTTKPCDSSDDVHLPDSIEFQSMEECMLQWELLREEARDACLTAIQDHFNIFVAENPNVSYEEWIEELHPENAKSQRNLVRGKSIDHRFYVEGSDHRELWNSNLGDGQREFVPIRPYTPVEDENSIEIVDKENSFLESPATLKVAEF